MWDGIPVLPIWGLLQTLGDSMLFPFTGSFPIWLLLLFCAGLIVGTVLLLQLAFPGFL